MMPIHLGILSDPAKYDLYSNEFYEIFAVFQNTTFSLIGASEKYLKKQDIVNMYNRVEESMQKRKHFSPINNITNSKPTPTSYIGLFPSSTNHLIKGPKFVFAPIPINSKSGYLKMKAKVATWVVSKTNKAKIIPVAYHPMGGKAADRTLADKNHDEVLISKRFEAAVSNNFFKLYYLEAGSGQQKLNSKIISRYLTTVNKRSKSGTVVDRAIYGGGIKSKKDIEEILYAKTSDKKLVPQIIIVGNISEINISETYKIAEVVADFNKDLE